MFPAGWKPCRSWTTSRTGNGTCRPPGAPYGKDCSPRSASPRRTARPTTCKRPTPGLLKKQHPSPPPASAPWTRPRPPSRKSPAGSAAATTRPANRSTPKSPRSWSAKPVISWQRGQDAITAASRLDGLYALATNLPGHNDGTELTALDILKIYKDQWIVEQRHRDLKQTLRVRPVFLHNDDRIEALIAVIGIALLIFGLIEAELRAALGPGVPLPGILPEGRAAIPTARAALAAFDGLCATYTTSGLVLDHLTSIQRTILALLNIPLPWPEKLT